MKAIVISKKSSSVADQIEIKDIKKPVVQNGHAIIKSEATALNHLDLWVGRGLPGLNTKFPFVSGSDGCGIVESVGEDVDTSWIGKRVVVNAAVPFINTVNSTKSIKMIGEHLAGTHSEFFTAPISNLLPIKSNDPIKAAGFGLVFLTAWSMLVTKGNINKNSKLLITGIGGGVALACLEIARHFGCKTFVTSRHEWKLTEAKNLGAHEIIHDQGQDFSSTIRKLTKSKGVDIVADSIGSSVHNSCLKSLADNGKLILPGCTSGNIAQTDLARIFWKQLSIIGSTMGNMDEFKEAVELFDNNKIKPKIDTVFEWKKGKDAYKKLEEGSQFGKIVIDWRSN